MRKCEFCGRPNLTNTDEVCKGCGGNLPLQKVVTTNYTATTHYTNAGAVGPLKIEIPADGRTYTIKKKTPD